MLWCRVQCRGVVTRNTEGSEEKHKTIAPNYLSTKKRENNTSTLFIIGPTIFCFRVIETLHMEFDSRILFFVHIGEMLITDLHPRLYSNLNSTRASCGPALRFWFRLKPPNYWKEHWKVYGSGDIWKHIFNYFVLFWDLPYTWFSDYIYLRNLHIWHPFAKFSTPFASSFVVWLAKATFLMNALVNPTFWFNFCQVDMKRV